MLHYCNDHIDTESGGDDEFQAYAVIGIALIALGEDIGAEMALRSFTHLMHYGEPVIRKAVPLAIGLLCASNPVLSVLDTLGKYSHDTDIEVALNSIFAMGMVGAGTNNARVAQMLRHLASYYHKDASCLFVVRIAQVWARICFPRLLCFICFCFEIFGANHYLSFALKHSNRVFCTWARVH